MSAKLRKLTRKQKAFVEHIINHPKESLTDAAMAAYDVKGKGGAAVIAHENMQKPLVKLELERHSQLAEETLLDVMTYSRRYGKSKSGSKEQGASYAAIAVNASKDILDRVHGKATQRVEQTSSVVNLNIDLTPINT